MVKRPKLELSPDTRLVAAAYREWRSILESNAVAAGRDRRIDATNVWFRPLPLRRGKARLDFWIGQSTAAAVQLNEPETAGSEDPGTTMAVDARGRRYLLRQGNLHGNPPSARIDGVEFTRRTGLEPADVWVGGHEARKRWHAVARLDGRSDAVIRSDTAAFVRHCWNARRFGGQVAGD